MARIQRQKAVADWAMAAFGKDSFAPKHRALRMLEEAIELYQSAGGEEGVAVKLIQHIFTKPPGEIRREIGGVGITLLAMAECIGFDADDCEAAEFQRVLSKPLSHFTYRDQAKKDAGFDGTKKPTEMLHKNDYLLAADPMTRMDIHCLPCTKVLFDNRGGYLSERASALGILRIGEVYHVRSTEIGSDRTTVYLIEFPGERFNSVQFAAVE